MQIISSIQEIQQRMLQLRAEGKTIGFVPTMGFLHEGHMTLLQQARQENDIVVLSVFVNPLQFGPNEDFDRYPRDIERDEQLARETGADYLFYPSTEEMYPAPMTTKVTVTSRTDVLCGAKRPGHFDGVAAVLLKLFNIVMPHRAYFGLKDAQQVAVVQGVISDYNIPVTLVPVATVREADGLAKSSRNVYLSERERAQAPAIYQGLQLARQAAEQGERCPEALTALVRDHIVSHTEGEMDYIQLYSYPELESVSELAGTFIIAVAVKFARARLIDNIILTVE
ncbi:pantoate--beta-alanine ligase [Ectobacillus ponti]|uniref:Pantothenate synthetase n=1 Tax=Ectobacillus ponti TaxID=2961894 RepID=A0AA41X4I4_9BACI|nr:pantoate--beta-alanine ligase [Ectobacillus ponti]MCP8968781.1 pantoate--beta-alanine ligase [Ectobacillus ponti]